MSPIRYLLLSFFILLCASLWIVNVEQQTALKQYVERVAEIQELSDNLQGELIRAQNDIDLLLSDNYRLQYNTNNTNNTSATSTSMANEEAAKLGTDARQAYSDLRKGLIEKDKQIEGLQKWIKIVTKL